MDQQNKEIYVGSMNTNEQDQNRFPPPHSPL